MRFTGFLIRANDQQSCQPSGTDYEDWFPEQRGKSMRISKVVGWWSLFFFLMGPSSLRAQARNPRDFQKSCRNFVQGFYDWYVPKALKEGSGHAWDLALKNKGYVFSSEVSRLLKEDSEAQAKVAGEIVGLDFDPFLNSQDLGERYVVGDVTPKDDSYWAEVYAIRSGNKSEKPVAVPELVFKDGRWLFVNFHYGKSDHPERENLLSILKSLRKRRQEESK